MEERLRRPNAIPLHLAPFWEAQNYKGKNTTCVRSTRFKENVCLYRAMRKLGSMIEKSAQLWY